jgi:VWFA-related protein
MKRITAVFMTVVFTAVLAKNLNAQNDELSMSQEPTLKVNSRAVLVDVVVTDRDGNPVKGLNKDDFKILEDGKTQRVDYFEEHTQEDLARRSQKLEFPTLPPNVFSNFSPLPTPPAVNVLLLDALNTPMDDQMWLRRSAQHYLKTLKPGSRLAIFVMGMRLSFVEGFSDDPALLATALGYRKRNEAEVAVMLQSMGEQTAQNSAIAMMLAQEDQGSSPVPAVSPESVAAFRNFLQENRYGQDSDREAMTLQELNQLATFLGGFPGRKNVIWMSGAFPLDLFGQTQMRFDDAIRTTLSLLSAARVAIYPVDARGATVQQFNTAENVLDPTISRPWQLLGPTPGVAAGSNPNSGEGAYAGALTNESEQRGNSNSTMDMLAEQTGGKAFYNQNDLTGIIGKVVGSSADFYTLSYTPSDSNMDGGYRNIQVKLDEGGYKLSYRRGYFARGEGLPGAAGSIQQKVAQEASQDPSRIDPLAAFMQFGMPQTEQILYKTRVQHAAPKPDAGGHGAKDIADRYTVDFAVNLNDIGLETGADGIRRDKLNIGLVVYDRYGQVVAHEEHLIELNVKPDVYAVFQKNGVQLHGAVNVPKGNYWLRTGIYDERTRKVGTMEVPLRLVKSDVASK